VNIGIDVDSVLADLWAIAGPMMPMPIAKDEVVSWEYPCERLGISKSHFLWLLDYAWRQWESMPLQDDPAVLAEMRKLGHQVTIITRRIYGTTAPPRIAAWLHAHRIVYDNLVFVVGAQSKFAWIDCLVDDNPGLVAACTADTAQVLYLYNQPWNRWCPITTSNVKRVGCLQEVLDDLR